MRVLRPLVLASLLLTACQGAHTGGDAASPSSETATSPGAPGPAAPSPADPSSGSTATPATPATPAGNPGAASSTATPALALAVVDGRGASGPFRLGELARLALQLQVSGPTSGDHQVRLDVVSPEGTLYAQIPVRIAGGTAGAGAANPGLQVRGTDIESLHRTGTWTFRAYVDGGAQPSAIAQAQVTE